MVILTGRCAAAGCTCDHFEPRCGCGHLLTSHMWGTPPDQWGCAQCVCRHFGACQDEVATDEPV